MKPAIKQRTSVEQAFFQELVEYMSLYPKQIEHKILKIGNEVLGFYRDDNFSISFLNFKEMSEELFLYCSTDLIHGAVLLKKYSVGIAFNGKELVRFVVPYGDTVSGTVLLRISLKDQSSFAKWKKNLEEEIDQDLVNSAIYSLAYFVSLWTQNSGRKI